MMAKKRRGRPRVMGEDVSQVALKLPSPVLDALTAAAKQNYESTANYIRRAVVDRLRAEGYLPKTAPPQGDQS